MLIPLLLVLGLALASVVLAIELKKAIRSSSFGERLAASLRRCADALTGAPHTGRPCQAGEPADAICEAPDELVAARFPIISDVVLRADLDADFAAATREADRLTASQARPVSEIRALAEAPGKPAPVRADVVLRGDFDADFAAATREAARRAASRARPVSEVRALAAPPGKPVPLHEYAAAPPTPPGELRRADDDDWSVDVDLDDLAAADKAVRLTSRQAAALLSRRSARSDALADVSARSRRDSSATIKRAAELDGVTRKRRRSALPIPCDGKWEFSTNWRSPRQALRAIHPPPPPSFSDLEDTQPRRAVG